MAMKDNELYRAYCDSRDEDDKSSPGGSVPAEPVLTVAAPFVGAELRGDSVAMRVDPVAPDSSGLPEGYPPPILRNNLRGLQIARKLEVT